MEIIITGCIDCPLCHMNDFCPGHSCGAFFSSGSNEEIIKSDKNFQIITPEWCPAKTGGVKILYNEK